MNDESLPTHHGFPLLLIVPGWYGMNSVKCLAGIHLLDHEFKGFYRTQRYMTMNEPGSATPYTYRNKMKVKSIITNPAPGEIMPAAGYTLAGASWTRENHVVMIEVSDGAGATWTKVGLTHPPNGYSRYRWEHWWEPTTPGHYVLMCRATNDKSETLTVDYPNKLDGRGYGNNIIFPFPVEVSGV